MLVKLYVREETTPRAIDLFERTTIAPLCDWQRLETRNAIRLKAFRGEISDQQMIGSLRDFDADIGAGVWQPCAPETDQLFRRAEALSAANSPVIGARTMDIVHIAAALLLGSDAMATFDHRQARLAGTAGLQVLGAP